MDIGSYVDDLVGTGRYHFTTGDAASALGSSLEAVRAAIRRLRAKGRLATPHRGFHVVVPPEYRGLGCLPAEQFVPQLMQYLGVPYYVGVLSAASLHGAAHQAPMVFQVVVADNRPAIRCGRVKVQFIARGNAAVIPTVQRNTARGVLLVSTIEATAFDLVGYPGHAGGLSNVATILGELIETVDADRLVEEVERAPLPWAQRLGYLLERVEAEDLAARLFDVVDDRARDYVPLRARKACAGTPRDRRWRLLVNDDVEAEL